MTRRKKERRKKKIEITLLWPAVLREARSITKMDYSVGQKKQIELQLRPVLWCVLACHIKDEQSREGEKQCKADGGAMSQACLSEATDVGT